MIAGYTGGKESSPCYERICDHTEALFIEYNPKRISYYDILEHWRCNDYPWEPDTLRHRSALFPVSEEQRKTAYKYLFELQRTKPNCRLYVHVGQQATRFYQAEEEQQDYVSKQRVAAKKQLIAWANNEAPTGLFTIME